MTVYLDDGDVRLMLGDCVEVMRELLDASVDAVVCDPPYGLEFMGKDWDRLSDDPVSRSWDAKGRTMTDAPGHGGPVLYRRDNPRCDHCGRVINGRATAKGFKVCECDTPAPRLTGSSARKMQAWHEAWAREAFRVLKPGGHLAAFGGTRTYHRLACAVEDAGFEVRDSLCWLYGSGFPKSLDVSKAIDRRRDWKALHELQAAIRTARTALGISQSEAARRCGLIGPDERLGGGGFMWFETGLRIPTRDQWPRLKEALSLSSDFDAAFEAAEREVTGEYAGDPGGFGEHRFSGDGLRRDVPATPEALRWQGWGTALKPAYEPIVLARKPLTGTVAANVQQHGTGALNIDACRIDSGDEAVPTFEQKGRASAGIYGDGLNGSRLTGSQRNYGRWPANVVLDEAAAALLDEQSGERIAAPCGPNPGKGTVYGAGEGIPALAGVRGYPDQGGASRFFYTAKASRSERGDDNTHPTVKPVALMRWLIRLVTPPGGLILDPFCGSGTTPLAARQEGYRCIAIDREADYLGIAARRTAQLSLLATGGTA